MIPPLPRMCNFWLVRTCLLCSLLHGPPFASKGSSSAALKPIAMGERQAHTEETSKANYLDPRLDTLSICRFVKTESLNWELYSRKVCLGPP